MKQNADATSQHGHQSFWLWVMCLTGVDYFSTLGYQPSIAFEATGLLAPLATVVLVVVTLFGALPVYCYVARKSPHGQGSIGMLEHLVHGWSGKVLVLILLGFAATDFVITKTLSAADAAQHLIANPGWRYFSPLRAVEEQQRLVVTMFLLVVLGAMFMRGFREVIGLAVVIVAVYLVLNAVVVGSGVHYLLEHPERLEHWYEELQSGDWHLEHQPLTGHNWWIIAAVCLLVFPKLALGLSGFETGVAVMPLIRGNPNDSPEQPRGRTRNTRKLLVVAALIMSVYLLGSATVVSTLIPPEALIDDDPTDEIQPAAKDRALAYLAHGEGPYTISPLFGEVFGTIYDLSTVIILWFAGASAMAGLLNLVPRYLPRYGMAPEWASAMRPLVILFTAINLFVTWVFKADVSAQGGAYATGVLVLMSSACVATVIERWRGRAGWWTIFRVPWYFVLVTVVFLYTTAAVIVEKPDGIKIASFFIVAIIVSSLVSRFLRSTELRFTGFRFLNPESQFLWASMKHLEFPVLVPHRPGSRGLAEKEEIIRREHRLDANVPIVFIEAELGDASDFYQEPVMEVTQQEERFILRIRKCASIAHVLAAVMLELSAAGKPPEIHFGWSKESPLAANLSFLLFGEGNVPWLVHELLLKAEPDDERRPRVVIG